MMRRRIRSTRGVRVGRRCALGRWGAVRNRAYHFGKARSVDPGYWGGYFWGEYYRVHAPTRCIWPGVGDAAPMGVAAWAMVTSGVERIMVGTTSHEVISMLVRGLWRDMCARVPMGHGLRRIWLAADVGRPGDDPCGGGGGMHASRGGGRGMVVAPPGAGCARQRGSWWRVRERCLSIHRTRPCRGDGHSTSRCSGCVLDAWRRGCCARRTPAGTMCLRYT